MAAYHAPKSTKAYICEFQLGPDMIRRYFGSSMHVFLLDIPSLEFAALIPKRSYVTVCLLGEDIDKNLVQSFLDSPSRVLPSDCRTRSARSSGDSWRAAARVS